MHRVTARIVWQAVDRMTAARTRLAQHRAERRPRRRARRDVQASGHPEVQASPYPDVQASVVSFTMRGRPKFDRQRVRFVVVVAMRSVSTMPPTSWPLANVRG